MKAEIYSLRDAGALAKLDAYEGCVEADPSALFIRLASAWTLWGWTAGCTYNRDVTGHLPIPTGDWIAYCGLR